MTDLCHLPAGELVRRMAAAADGGLLNPRTYVLLEDTIPHGFAVG